MPVFVQSGSSLNKYWVEMLDAMLDADCRAVYLLTFESAMLGSTPSPLYDEEIYKDALKQYEIPEKPDAVVPFKSYRAWVRVYTEILRKFDMLGLLAPSEVPKCDGDLEPFLEVMGK